MKKVICALTIAGLWAFSPTPAFGVSREIIRIMQQLDTLQQTVQNMQKTIDTQTAIIRTLVERASDNVNDMKSTVADLQKASQKNLAATDARFDTLTSQIQALSESLEEAKARIAKLNDQVTKTQNIIQTLNTQPPAPAGEQAAAAGGQPAAVPDPGTLFNSGKSYMTGGQYDLAIQAFQDFLKNYGDSDMAANAQYYIGESYLAEKNYTQAIIEYNTCLDRYPNGSVLPAAQLHKSDALLKLDQKTAAVKELRSLIARFPNSREADMARQRLKTLRVAVR